MYPDWLSQLRLAEEPPGHKKLRHRGGGASWHRQDKGRPSPRGTFLPASPLHTWTRACRLPDSLNHPRAEPSPWEAGRDCPRPQLVGLLA